MKKVKLFEQFIAEKREDIGKYNTVKKVVAELGRKPSEQELATFINNNYYDVTEVERGEDDPSANDKIADLVAFYKFDIDDWQIAWADAQNESVVTEAKNTIGLAFKEEQDYLDFVEFIKDEGGSIKKDFGWDSKTKSWEVIMDVKVLDSIYGEGTPSNKESGWYGALPGDFESVIIESLVTENIRIGKVLAIKKYNAKTNRKEVVDVRVTDYIKKPGSKDFVEYDLKGKKRKVSVDVFKSMIAEGKFNATEGVLCEATVEMDAMDPDNKDFLKFLKKNRVKIISKEMQGPNGMQMPVITMQGKRKDLENVLADGEYGWDDADLAEYIEESVVTEGVSKDRMIKQIKRALKDGTAIFKLPMDTQNYYRKNKSDFES